ncbi:MAG: glyoxalase [Alphaproteobacteria bacterium]|nr:glyoxalase [Alphaproteobacteria bacterium]
MITHLDHLVVAVRDLDSAIAQYTALFGRAPAWRAETGEGTATASFGLANAGLELIAPSGSGAVGERLGAILDEKGEGLVSLAFAVSDMGETHRRLARVGLEPEAITEASRRNLLDGTTRDWRMTRAATAKTAGVRLFFLDGDGTPRAEANAPAPVTGLDHVVVQTPAPDRAAALYGARLGLPLALDRTAEQWGTRFLFFRCGDAILEVTHSLKDGAGEGPDRLWGITWRVDDADAAQARMAAAGLPVSDVRPGRKPGTRVFTVREKTCGVPTLMLEAKPAR